MLDAEQHGVYSAGHDDHSPPDFFPPSPRRAAKVAQAAWSGLRCGTGALSRVIVPRAAG
jgi:hypothetical protein